ncbi:SCO4402 family protein, partial [Marinobacter sp. 1Y8]
SGLGTTNQTLHETWACAHVREPYSLCPGRAMKVENPAKRDELIDELRCLSDHAYLVKHWVDLDYDTSKIIINFDETVHFFFDDTPLADDPSQWVGYCLLNEAEVQSVSKVVFAIDEVLSRHGSGLTDEEYLNTKEWPQVEFAARAAHRMLAGNQGET